MKFPIVNSEDAANVNSQIRHIYLTPDLIISKSRSIAEKYRNFLEMVENGIRRKDDLILYFKKAHVSQKSPKRNFSSNSSELKIKFPSETSSESWRFVAYLRIIQILFENLVSSKVVTRRDVYYQDVALFKSQTIVDECIETLCFTLEAKNYEIGAVSSQKGLVYGNLALEYPVEHKSENSLYLRGFSNGQFEIKTENGPTLIPIILPGIKIKSTSVLSLKCILVIEKEAVFQRLCSRENQDKIIVTGKGFPDNLTKTFLNLLSKSFANVPIFGFADSDIYGIMIMKNYKFGNNSNSLENYRRIGNCGYKDKEDNDFFKPKKEFAVTDKKSFSIDDDGNIFKNDNDLIISNLQYSGIFLTDYKRGWQRISLRDFDIMKRFISDFEILEILESQYQYSISKKDGLPKEEDYIARAASLEIETSNKGLKPRNYSSTLHLMKREVQRGMFLLMKCEMNVAEEHNPVPESSTEIKSIFNNELSAHSVETCINEKIEKMLAKVY